MNNKRMLVAWLIVTSALVFLGACNDGGTIVDPEPFHVVLEVVTPSGSPVSGLELGLAPDTPFYQDGKSPVLRASLRENGLGQPRPSPFNPVLTIPFEVTQPGTVSIAIEDVAKETVRLLGREAVPAGSHAWMWNGMEDDGIFAPSGVYYVHLTQVDTETATMMLDVRRPVLLAILYPSQRVMGTTDAAGRIVLSDRRLFPYLFDVEPFPAVNEDGEVIGSITLTPTMRFYFTDPDSGRTLRFDGDVTGSTNLHFVWDHAP